VTLLAELLGARAAEAPTAPVFESARDDRVLTRGQLPPVADRWAAALAAAGVPAGARVGLFGRDPLLFAAAWLGVIAAGRCAAPVAPDLAPAALDRWRGEVRPWVVVDVDDSSGTEPPPLGGVSAGAAGPAGVLLTSSGTTGPAKLVALREDQLLTTAHAVVTAHRLTTADRGLNPLPLWHVNAEVVGLLATLVAGGRLVLDDRFHRTGFWQLVAARNVTWINAVPAILAILARADPEPRPPRTVRFARSASAPLPPSVLRAFEDRTGVPVVQTYGMTEAGSQLTAERLPDERDPEHRPGGVGRPVGVDLRIVDDAGETVAAGRTGRVQVRGAGVITAYASPAGADSFTSDGWLDTGDLGHLDAWGDLSLEGRGDDVINRGGEKFSPLHVEDVLLGEPGVASVAVVGVPDPVLGQVPVAVVVPGPGPVSDVVARVLARAERELDRPRRPVRVHLADSLPGGVNGKVSRREVLRRLVEGGLT